jgi:hypothetical protein
MRIQTLLLTTTLLFFVAACSAPTEPTPVTPPQAAGQTHGDMLQVMRGVLYPNSNIVFAAQGTNPAELKQAADPATATDPLLSTYGGWTAVENSGIAMAEAANLLTMPRKCSNGLEAPVNAEDWKMFVQGLRDAGMKAYQAGQSKNQDNVLDAADAVTTACANCHDKYRDVPGGDPDRCK